MYCSGCGRALVAGQGYCPRCGRESGLGIPVAAVPTAQQIWPPLAQIERRIQTLAVAWLVYAGLAAITGLIGMAVVHRALGEPHVWGDHGFGSRLLWMEPGLPFFWLRFAWVAFAVRVGLALAAGLGLLQRTTWGRWVAIVAGCISLLHPVLGTALGIWTLAVLLRAQNAAGYEAMAR